MMKKNWRRRKKWGAKKLSGLTRKGLDAVIA